MSTRVPGSQIRCVITRAPRELMFCVRTGSIIDGWSKLYNCTGSTADIRSSDRESRAGDPSFDDVGSDGITLLAFRAKEFAPWNAVLCLRSQAHPHR